MRRMGFALTCLAAVATSAPGPALAWDGVDSRTGQSVAIESGNLVRSGNDIEIYDTQTGQYRDVTVEDVNRYGSTVEIEVYDHATGESRTLEMED